MHAKSERLHWRQEIDDIKMAQYRKKFNCASICHVALIVVTLVSQAIVDAATKNAPALERLVLFCTRTPLYFLTFVALTSSAAAAAVK